MENLQFQPDYSNLKRLQDEQLLREYKAYNVGACAMSKTDVIRGKELFDAELASKEVLAAANAIVSEAVQTKAELSAV